MKLFFDWNGGFSNEYQVSSRSLWQLLMKCLILVHRQCCSKDFYSVCITSQVCNLCLGRASIFPLNLKPFLLRVTLPLNRLSTLACIDVLWKAGELYFEAVARVKMQFSLWCWVDVEQTFCKAIFSKQIFLQFSCGFLSKCDTDYFLDFQINSWPFKLNLSSYKKINVLLF